MRPRGQPALVRWVLGVRVARILPVIVVSDRPEGTAVYLRAGTPTRERAGLDGVPIDRTLPYAERFSGAWGLGDGVWSGSHAVVLAPVGAAHAFFAFWSENWEFRGWYVNLQDQLRLSRFGWDTTDNVLDLVVARDLSSWRWKDEDELREAVRLGRFTEEQALELYAEGERALETVERRAWPFDRDWSGWRPDPSWPQPQLDPAADEL